MTSIAVSIDLRSMFGPARDQGKRPTCAAFAVSDAHAALRKTWTPLSCEYVFYHAQRRAGRPPDRGALLPVLLTALREDGQPEENEWPYLTSTPDRSTWVPPPIAGTLFGRASTDACPSLEDLTLELDRGNPLIILLTLSRAFDQPSGDAVIQPEEGEVPETYRRHAVVCVGHGFVDKNRAFLVRNSWGPKWGRAGYGWLTDSFLGPRIFAAVKLLEDVHVSCRSVAA